MTFETPTHPGSQAAGVVPDTNCEGAAPARRKTRPRPWPRRARRGMVGMLLTIALVAIAIVYLISLYVQSNNSIRTQATQGTITALEAEIRRSFANRREYATGAYEDFLAPRMPQSAQRGAAGSEEIITPWGGEITAGPGTTIGTNTTASSNRFWIRIQNLPRNACIAIAESFLESSSVVSVNVGTDSANTTFVTTGTNALIETNCDGEDNDQVGVVFRG